MTPTPAPERPNPTKSRSLNKFHKRGLINRERLTSDRRVVKLQLSEKGLELVPRLARLVEAHNRMLLSGIAIDDITGFVATSHKIIQNYARHRAELAAENSG